MKLHIGIAAPIACADVAELLAAPTTNLPKGYTGAPFTAVLIKELLRQGHKVSAFTTDNTIYPEITHFKGNNPDFNFHVFGERPRAWRFNGKRLGRAVDGFAYERQILTQAMLEAQPDIIHAHWTYEFALAAIKTGLPHLITCHDAPAAIFRFNPYPYRAIRYLMARLAYYCGLNFSTVSDYMISAVQHYTKQPITLVPNPLADFVFMQGKIRQAPVTKRIGLICNGWEARKNPEPALLGFAEFSKNNPEAELHLFGHDFGPQQIAENWCKQQQIKGKFFFHGATPHQQMITQLNGLDLLLHPALEESFGVVIAEAMALGLPIVAGESSGAVPWVVGNMEQLNPKSGCAVLTDVCNPSAIKSAIEQAFNDDYPARSAYGYNRAKQFFTSEVVCDAYLTLYRQILSL